MLKAGLKMNRRLHVMSRGFFGFLFLSAFCLTATSSLAQERRDHSKTPPKENVQEKRTPLPRFLAPYDTLKAFSGTLSEVKLNSITKDDDEKNVKTAIEFSSKDEENLTEFAAELHKNRGKLEACQAGGAVDKGASTFAKEILDKYVRFLNETLGAREADRNFQRVELAAYTKAILDVLKQRETLIGESKLKTESEGDVHMKKHVEETYKAFTKDNFDSKWLTDEVRKWDDKTKARVQAISDSAQTVISEMKDKTSAQICRLNNASGPGKDDADDESEEDNTSQKDARDKAPKENKGPRPDPRPNQNGGTFNDGAGAKSKVGAGGGGDQQTPPQTPPVTPVGPTPVDPNTNLPFDPSALLNPFDQQQPLVLPGATNSGAPGTPPSSSSPSTPPSIPPVSVPPPTDEAKLPDDKEQPEIPPVPPMPTIQAKDQGNNDALAGALKALMDMNKAPEKQDTTALDRLRQEQMDRDAANKAMQNSMMQAIMGFMYGNQGAAANAAAGGLSSRRQQLGAAAGQMKTSTTKLLTGSSKFKSTTGSSAIKPTVKSNEIRGGLTPNL